MNFGAIGSKNYFDKFKKTTITRLTSGSGTYTVPTGVKRLRIQMVGGGGGGQGTGSVAWGGIGGTGGNTTFGSSLLIARGGAGGSISGGLGNFPSITAPAQIVKAVNGGDGNSGNDNFDEYVNTPSGNGGASYFGGEGRGVTGNSNGGIAKDNTGAGGVVLLGKLQTTDI